MYWLTFIITPLSGAVIGYFTNWLAIKMLFRPHTKKHVFGIGIPFTPGLLQKEKPRISKAIGETLSENILTESVMTEYLSSPETTTKIDSLINEKLDSLALSEKSILDYIYELTGGQVAFDEYMNTNLPAILAALRKFPGNNPDFDDSLRRLVKKAAEDNFGKFIGVFVNYDKAYDKIKDSIFEYLENTEHQAMIIAKAAELTVGGLISRLPAEKREDIKEKARTAGKTVLSLGGKYMIRSFEFNKIVEDTINGFDAQSTEKLILSIAAKELRAITIIGGVLGFVIGFAPVVISLIKL